MFELKKISPAGIPGALAKAEKYRLLNEPRDAESICRDILRTDPHNNPAQLILLLALTDQFGRGWRVNVNHARELVEKLPDEYQRKYYDGVIAERWAKCQLNETSPGHVVYEWLHHAMELYEQAMELSPAENEDAKLRWNACARIIRRNQQVRPRPEEQHHEATAGFSEEVPGEG